MVTAVKNKKASVEKKSGSAKGRFPIHHLKRAGGKVVKVIGNVKSRIKNRRLKVSFDQPLIDRTLRRKLLVSLSYLHLLLIFPLIFGRKNDFARFHLRQGLALLGLWVLALFFFWIPIIAWLAILSALVLSVIGLVNVFRNKERQLPYIGKCAQSLKF